MMVKKSAILQLLSSVKGNRDFSEKRLFFGRRSRILLKVFKLVCKKQKWENLKTALAAHTQWGFP